jgi:hypothetical protein
MKVDLQHITDIDWARLAAYIDGEGCISINKQHHRRGYKTFTLSVEIVNTDPRLMRWLKQFGGSIYMSRPPSLASHWKTRMAWKVTSIRATAILSGCLPYFVMKRDQAEVGIAFQKITTDNQKSNAIPSGLREEQSKIHLMLKEMHQTVGSKSLDQLEMIN